MRSRKIIVSCFVFLLGTLGIMHTKYYAARVRKNLLEKEKSYQKLLKNVHLLRIEWTHLTSPARLDRLNNRFLKLMPVTVSQIIDPSKRKIFLTPKPGIKEVQAS